ncbi:hypothetical protein ODJ79_37415 [Actinoplanes sp. KI2]|uniref:hypothetical protein n=1 Tax=Actinoplanes sp. KI2 TaxID=2983315 RepID=UPI0021D5E7C5|nr:hypothetical protein [Actinoplanes sp. KI2]MCU7729428.1 hypothetical protein [Actinoplanes sp. KI2]
MSTARPTAAELDAALAPVREALLRDAQAEADRLRDTARQDRDRRLAAARQRADLTRADACGRGHADAAAAGADDAAAAARAARRLILRARREAYELLRRVVAERVADWMAEPAVDAALRSRVAEVLGPGGSAQRVPGGLAGTAGGRRVEVTVSALADGALSELGPAVEQLWQP